jgi:hypothetical protein
MITIVLFIVLGALTGYAFVRCDPGFAAFMLGVLGALVGFVAACVVGGLLPKTWHEVRREPVINWTTGEGTVTNTRDGYTVTTQTKAVSLWVEVRPGDAAQYNLWANQLTWEPGNNELSKQHLGFKEKWYWCLGLNCSACEELDSQRADRRLVMYANDGLLAAVSSKKPAEGASARK